MEDYIDNFDADEWVKSIRKFVPVSSVLFVAEPDEFGIVKISNVRHIREKSILVGVLAGIGETRIYIN